MGAAKVIGRVLLGVSCVANIALATLLLGTLPDASDATPEPIVRAAPMQARVAPSRSAASYYRSLLGLGLDEHEAKLLLAAALQADAAGKLQKPVIRYWRRENAVAGYRLAASVAERAVRAALDELFGAAASDLPEFAALYRPIDLEFGFLDSDAQIKVRDWLLEQRAHGLSTITKPFAQAATVEPGDSPAAPPGLSTADAFEYELRASPIANMLRGSDVELTEQEFRDAYSALAATSSAPGNLDVQLQARRSLRDLLGTRRFEQLWAARDPAFAAVAEAGHDLSLDDGTLQAVFGVMNDAQERLLTLAADEGLDAGRSAESVRAVNAEEHRQLEDLVGVDAAARLLRVRAATLYALSRQAADGRRPPP